MSLKSRFLRSVALPAVLAFSLAAPSVASAECLPGVFNAQRGIKGADCYFTAEINKAMAAYGQKTRIVADRIAVADDATGQIITQAVHNRWTSSDDGKIGFNLEGDGPTGAPLRTWSVRSIFQDVVIWDRNKRVDPSPEIVGASLAKGIKKSQDHLMLSARNGPGYYVVVARDKDISVGSFLVANDRDGAGLAGLKNLDYAPGGREALAQNQGPLASSDTSTPLLALGR
jgi:hypothetical protein